MSGPFPANPALVAGAASLAALHKAVKARLGVVAAGFPILETRPLPASPDTPGTPRAPTVVDFTLPPKQGSSDDQFPFLALRVRTGTDSQQGADENAIATLDIEIGTYSDTDNGYFDLLEIIDAIRLDLAEAPAIDGTAFEHVGPLTFDIPFPQPRPQWLGLATTNWQIPRARRVEARNANPQQEA